MQCGSWLILVLWACAIRPPVGSCADETRRAGPWDVERLRELARAEAYAIRRDRYRAAPLALEGERAAWIARALGHSRRSMQKWAYAYRDGRTEALPDTDRSGRPTKLPRGCETEVRARLDAGSTPVDGICTLRGMAVVRILGDEFGVKHSVGRIDGVLEGPGYKCLKPRPSHEQSAPAAVEAFKSSSPSLSGL